MYNLFLEAGEALHLLAGSESSEYTLRKDCPLLLGEACQMRFIGCCGPEGSG